MGIVSSGEGRRMDFNQIRFHRGFLDLLGRSLIWAGKGREMGRNPVYLGPVGLIRSRGSKG